ncbi:MAG: PQQ-dependent sugar dehydrogenase [Verrucomicrobiae bacterium]|nr:PQQ-dependent sugar dehydrogenase [Verrucomicrobiae bacterium]
MIFWLAVVLLPAPGVARGQWLVSSPPSMPAVAPAAEYEAVNAFPSLSFPLRTDDIVGMTAPPGKTNELFVYGLFGKIFVITNLAAPTKTVFLDITHDTFAPGAVSSESGLAGMTFHPDFARNRYFYVFYTRTNRTEGRTYATLSRFEADPVNPWRALRESEQVLISQWDRNDLHQAGDLHFGTDGYLYVSLGDEGLQNDPFRNSQRIDKNFFSGILRIDVDGRPGSLAPNPHPAVGTGYRIPPDNPFIGRTSFNGLPVSPAAVRTEFWVVGLRNPHRFSIDPVTGDMLGGDVGGARMEEVNRYVRGGNYGWGHFEATLPNPGFPAPPPGFSHSPPLYAYSHAARDPNFGGRAVIGGLTYRGTAYPDLYGKYIFGDAIAGHVWSLSENGGGAVTVKRLTTVPRGMASFALHPATGEILAAELAGGRIVKLRRTPREEDPALPPTLSAARVFSSLASLTPRAGMMPYEVASTFWSDHALKRRWFFMQNAADRIQRDGSGHWVYPTGSVWVKHFDLELVRGDPTTRRRLETRFLVKSDSGAYGVTYKWRADGSDADLVPDAGLDEAIPVLEGDVMRVQNWRYPGRSECLICHNGAAQHVLGFNALQLNREIPSGAGAVNQISHIASLGVFQQAPPDPALLPRLADIADAEATLEHRFKTYLEVNCAYCHQPGGIGRGVWDGRFSTPLAESGILNGVPGDDLGVLGARIVAPGNPEASVLWRRIAALGAYHMPPLGTDELHAGGIRLVREFIEGVRSPATARSVWQIGHDSPAGSASYMAEFSPQNNRTDPAPGSVTRFPGDPQYLGGSNPGPDDHFYFAGNYPAGFNGLTESLVVPNDEPWRAWERAHTLGDPVNTMHFVLEENQVMAGARFRLQFEFPMAGFAINGVWQSGYGVHDLSIRFRNGGGIVTPLFTGRLTAPGLRTVEFTAASVGATAGPNTIEFARTGPADSGRSYWLEYDHVRLECLATGNTAPVLAFVQTHAVDVLQPWALQLEATDRDLPANRLSYALVSGPAGLTVSPTGRVQWTPASGMGGATHNVVVRVTDDGTPPLSSTGRFSVFVRGTANPEPPPPQPGIRTRWQIGENAPEGATGGAMIAEFSPQNNQRDAAPGLVTRLAGDPWYSPTENPGADDDFYFAGTYAAGFNGLPSVLGVAHDEPWKAWERALTVGDPVNRMHFVLDPTQVVAGSRFRLTFEFGSAGYSQGGVIQPGFGEHEVAVRFRNGAGDAVTLYSDRFSGPMERSVEFGAVEAGATAGGNTIEFVRTGPTVPNTGYWLEFDHVLLEAVSVPPQIRTRWQIGENAPEGATGGAMIAEFSPQNNQRDAAPGLVTRLAGDPWYSPTENPGADDDFYFAGTYAAGFNGLPSVLGVAHDEPWKAWERALTVGDPVNRMHFVLDPTQVVAGSRFRLTFEFGSAGYSQGGVIQPGFGEHEVAVRFRNGAGDAVTLYSDRFSGPMERSVEFGAVEVGATAGGNTIEFVRTGPTVPNTGYWLEFDHVLLEAGNRVSGLVPGSPVAPETLPADLARSAPALVRDRVTVDGLHYLTLTYALSEGAATWVDTIEASEDLLEWTPADVLVVEDRVEGGVRRVTVRDLVPFGAGARRFLRLRAVGPPELQPD